ncbi:MAG: hypothetical protein HYV97_13605 [Bdellovibrio sp.]|nr:hypothetical protein [Bdellovibrio sp.]
MLGNLLLFTLLFCALLYVWYFLSLIRSNGAFKMYRHVSFFAIISKEYEANLISASAKIFFFALKLILLFVIIGSLDFFSFSENRVFFTGYSGAQVKYESLFYGLFVWEILRLLENFFENAGKIETIFQKSTRSIFFLLFFFSFSNYYQTPFSDYLVLRQQETIFWGIKNLGCISHIFFFLLFLFYIAHDLSRLGSNVIQSKIGLLSGVFRFVEIFLLQLFLIYAFLGWTSQIPFTEILTDKFPDSRGVFEVLSLFVKLICVHFCGVIVGKYFGNVESIYIRGIEKYLHILSGLNVIFLIGLQLWS